MTPHSPPKILFLGSSHFAVPSLRALVALGMRPVVVTKPDKPAGRGNKLQATPVKEAAVELRLPVLQPTDLTDSKFFAAIEKETPDLIVSIAYGHYITPEILKLPRYGCVNLHPSLLPKYRGAAPVQRALMAGEKETGNTLAYVTETWDGGDVLLQDPYPIEPLDNAETLLEKLSVQGASLIKKGVPLLLEQKLKSKPQNHAQATSAPKIKESETWIDWTKKAGEILNQVRGLSPQPGAKSRINQSVLKIHQAHLVPGDGNPGEIVELQTSGPVVATGENRLLLLQVQPENRNVMSGKDYVNGYRLQTGQNFQN